VAHPGHCRAIVRLHWDTTTEVLRLLVDCGPASEEWVEETGEQKQDCHDLAIRLLQLRYQTLEQASKMQDFAVDFEKDAAKMQMLPLFQIDPKLKAEIVKVTRDIEVCAFVPQMASKMLLDAGRRRVVLGRGSTGRKKLESLLQMFERGIDADSDKEETEENAYSVEVGILNDDAEIDLELFLRTIRWLKDEMRNQEEVLNTIKWGF